MKRQMLALVLIFMVSLSIMTDARAISDEARTLKNLTNSDRKAKNVPTLRLDAEVSRKALAHSKWMADNGLKHSKSLSPYLKGEKWTIAGENIGSGPDIKVLEQAFMNSAPHRRNILEERFKKVGVGVYWDGTVYWVTVIFYG